MSIPIYQVSVPEYNVHSKPDFKIIGEKIDKCLKKHFLGHSIAIRVIGSQEHPGKSITDLVKLIKKFGTDRYNPARIGDRYENIGNKHIDFFALDFKVKENGKYFEQFIEPFYEWPKKSGEKPIRIDIAIIFDRSKLKRVVHQYEGRKDIKRDGFVFLEPNKKKSAIKGIIKIL